MINITDKTNCCGCGACFNICSKQAITMEYDNEGFLSPVVDNSKCIKCGLCLKVCPVINNKKENKILKVYGARNKNLQDLQRSTSGGMFSIIANYVLEHKGIVFGASFDKKWKVVHKYVDNKEQLDDLRRSKYVQSDIGITYKQAKEFLDNNKLVLFSGTPCQIAGLKNFLQKDYQNLITIDLICHGVPSPLVWNKFLTENFDIKEIKYINFRDKRFGWQKCYLAILKHYNAKKIYDIFINILYFKNIIFDYYFHNLFLKAFLYNLILRQSCYGCVFKGHNCSDFTVGDLWGVKKFAKQMYDKKGISVLIINSQKAEQIFEKIKNNMEYKQITFDDMVKYNPMFVTSAKEHPNREQFFKQFNEIYDHDKQNISKITGKNINKLISQCLNKQLLIIKIIKKVLKKI